MGGSVIESSLPVQDDEEIYAPEPVNEDEQGPTFAERAAAASNAAIEAEARRGGWRPLAEFRGNPVDWRDAKEFLERGRNVLPIVRDQLDRTRQELTRVSGDVSGMREQLDQANRTITELRDSNKRSEQVGYDRALRELKARQRDAVASQNIEEFDAVSEQISELEEQRAAQAPAPAPAPQPQPKALEPAIQQFIADNPWFMKDEVLHQTMQAEHAALSESAPGLGLAENLRRAKEATMARHPEKFGMAADTDTRRPKRPTITAPNGGQGAPERPQQERARTIASIQDPVERAEVRRGYDAAKNGMPDLTESVFLSVYENPKLDVLELMRQERTKRKA